MLMIKSLSRARPRNSKNEKVKKWKVAGTLGMREGGEGSRGRPHGGNVHTSATANGRRRRDQPLTEGKRREGAAKAGRGELYCMGRRKERKSFSTRENSSILDLAAKAEFERRHRFQAKDNSSVLLRFPNSRLDSRK